MKIILDNPLDHEVLSFIGDELVTAGIPIERVLKDCLTGMGTGRANHVMLELIDKLYTEDNEHLYNYCNYVNTQVEDLILPFHDAFLSYIAPTVIPRIKQQFEVTSVTFIDDGLMVEINAPNNINY